MAQSLYTRALDHFISFLAVKDRIIRHYLKEKGGKNPPDIESLIAKEILPIRPNRQNERKVKAKSPVSFNYRYD